jgi:hypothetical protein
MSHDTRCIGGIIAKDGAGRLPEDARRVEDRTVHTAQVVTPPVRIVIVTDRNDT